MVTIGNGWLMANGSRMVTGVERKWRLVRGRVVFTRGGGSAGGKMRMKVRIFVADGDGSALSFSKDQTLRFLSGLRVCSARWERTFPV